MDYIKHTAFICDVWSYGFSTCFSGLSPAVALVSSGLGTLAYLLITRGQIPAYLGSSFAFIAPILAAKASGGPESAMIGCFAAGLIYGIIALIIKNVGIKWLMNLLPPIVVGPVIMVIGLSLAGTAVNLAMFSLLCYNALVKNNSLGEGLCGIMSWLCSLLCVIS